MSFPAQYPGKCVACLTRFAPGDMIKYVDGQIYGEGCCEGPFGGDGKDSPLAMSNAEARASMCQRCFMIHAGECP